jgi:anaerobic selenocysteine-containing dehydrogenase
MKVQVEDGRIRRIEPHSGNQATPGSACLKGLAYVERVHSPGGMTLSTSSPRNWSS